MKAESFCTSARTADSLAEVFRHEAGDLIVRVLEGPETY
jgi:hypothetical protein